MLNWLRRRKAEKLTSGPIASQGRFYYLMSYDEEYEDLFSMPHFSTASERDVAIAELFIFRFWLTQCVYRLCKPDIVTDDEILKKVIPTGATLGKNMFERLNQINVEDVLAGDFAGLINERFSAYDNAFIGGKTASDPFGLTDASRLLAFRIFDDPEEAHVNYLTDKAQDQLMDIATMWRGAPHESGSSTLSKETQNASSNTIEREWILVNEFGENRTYLDSSSIEEAQDHVSVDVLYDLKPSGTDKRNNRPVKQMRMREEYDLSQDRFRVRQIHFMYEDGTYSDTLGTSLEWNEASAGNAKTLMMLRALTRRAAATGGRLSTQDLKQGFCPTCHRVELIKLRSSDLCCPRCGKRWSVDRLHDQ